MSYAIGENERLIANMIRIGDVASVDLVNARVVVEAGGDVTDDLPWIEMRTGTTRTWSPPSVGEQVVVLSPYGDLGQAVVLRGLYQDAHPAPSDDGNKEVIAYPDGSTSEHDSGEKSYTYSIPAGGKITLQVGSTSLVLEDGKATLNAAQFEHVGEAAVFEGTATVTKLLSWLAGVAGNAGSGGGANAITGGVNVVGGDVVVDGIGVKSHHHIEHDGPSTSAAQA